MTTTTEMKASHVDEVGIVIKGWDLDLVTAMQVACDEFNREDENCDHLFPAIPEYPNEPCMFLSCEVAEIWIRRRPGLPHEDWGMIFDTAKPGSRGAGRFTGFFFDGNAYETHRQIRQRPQSDIS